MLKGPSFKTFIYMIIIMLTFISCTTSEFVVDDNNSNSENGSDIELSTTTPTTQSSVLAPTIPPTTSVPTDEGEQNITPTPISSQESPNPPETLIPLPTLSSSEANRRIQNLIHSNGGCQLPCWWGITPGETTWQEAKQFLSTFVKGIAQGEETWINIEGKLYYSTNFTIFYDVENVIGDDCATISIRDNSIIGIEVLNICNKNPSFKLSNLLNQHGPPEEVWMVARKALENWIVIYVLFYPELGFEISYGQLQARLENGLIQGCVEFPGMQLWPPEEERHISDIIDLTGPTTWKPLEDGMGIDITTFYEIYSNPEQPPCFEVPESLWN